MSMRICNVCKVNKPFSDFFRNKKFPGGIAYTCKPCNMEAALRWKLENPERWLQNQRRYAANNAARKGKLAKQWALDNPDRRRIVNKTWVSANRDRVRANKAFAKYRRRLATPPWLTQQHRDEIAEAYRLARWLTRFFGVVYEVDHIIPISGELVCGLHVPWNLRVITAEENRTKSNFFEVG